MRSLKLTIRSVRSIGADADSILVARHRYLGGICAGVLLQFFGRLHKTLALEPPNRYYAKMVQAHLSSHNERPQVWKAYKDLLRYIHARGLDRGDLLPTQREFRKELGFSNDTLNVAMKKLVEAGVVVRKRHVGTMVADRTSARPVWSVGVLSLSREDQVSESFYTELLIRIQAAVSRKGARCLTYPMFKRNLPAPSSSFEGAQRDLECGLLDGLLTVSPLDINEWRALESRGIPICHTHWWSDAPCGVLLDAGAIAEQAIVELVNRGARRIAAPEEPTPHTSHQQMREGVVRGLERVGLRVTPENWLPDMWRIDLSEAAFDFGVRLARRLLARPMSERPEGLVLFDDVVTQGLAAALREAGEYRPLIASQTNRQIPLRFDLPVIRFDVDIDELAQRSVNLLLRRLINPATPERVEWVQPLSVQADNSKPVLLTAG